MKYTMECLQKKKKNYGVTLKAMYVITVTT